MQTTYTGASTQIRTIMSLYADLDFYKIASSANASLAVSPNSTIAQIAKRISAPTIKSGTQSPTRNCRYFIAR